MIEIHPVQTNRIATNASVATSGKKETWMRSGIPPREEKNQNNWGPKGGERKLGRNKSQERAVSNMQESSASFPLWQINGNSTKSNM